MANFFLNKNRYKFKLVNFFFFFKKKNSHKHIIYNKYLLLF